MTDAEKTKKLMKDFDKYCEANGGTRLKALRKILEEKTNVSEEMSDEELIQLLEEIIKRLKKND